MSPKPDYVKKLDDAIAAGEPTPGQLRAIKRILADAEAEVRRVILENPTDWGLAHAEAMRAKLARALAGTAERLGDEMRFWLGEKYELGAELVERLARDYEAEMARRFETLDDTLLKVIQATGADLVVDITADTLAKLTTEIQLAIAAELSPMDAMERIEKGLAGESGVWPSTELRAEAIYRTELGRAFSAGSYARMEEWETKRSGLLKVWRHSGGTLHPRKHHVKAESDYSPGGSPGPIPMDGLFVLTKWTKKGRVTFRCRYPKDPVLPAGETVFCGCSIGPYRKEWAG